MTVSGNIYKLYAIKFAKWFMLFMPTVVLFYNDNGLEQMDIFLLQGIYSIAIVALEIPSGYFADVLGRKNTLIVGSILGFLGFVVYSFAHGFGGFLIAEIILGIGSSLISGADSAMLYDSLLAQNRDKEYIKMEGRMTSVGNFAEGIAGVVGALIAGTLSLRAPYYFQAATAFIAIPASILLVEPHRHKVLKKMQFKDIVDIFKYSIFKNRPLRLNIVFSAIIGTSTLSMAWFVQPYFIEADIPTTIFGVLWTLINLSVAFTSLVAYKFEQKLGQVRTVLFIAIFISAGYLLSGLWQTWWGIGFLLMFHLVRGFATPVLKDYINRMVGSDIRATVLSVRNFIIRLVFAAIGPFLGYITDHYSLGQALLLAGVLFGIFGIVSVVLYIKVIRD